MTQFMTSLLGFSISLVLIDYMTTGKHQAKNSALLIAMISPVLCQSWHPHLPFRSSLNPSGVQSGKIDLITRLVQSTSRSNHHHHPPSLNGQPAHRSLPICFNLCPGYGPYRLLVLSWVNHIKLEDVSENILQGRFHGSSTDLGLWLWWIWL